MLEKEFKYYRDHQSELASQYKGKYIVIIGEKVIAHTNRNLKPTMNRKKATRSAHS